VARKQSTLDDDKFFAFLNDADDMKAIIHGHAELVALIAHATGKLLRDHGVTSEPIERLGIVGQVDVLALADRLDAETRDLFLHLTKVRNRFAHAFGTEFTKTEGIRAWDLLPKAAQDSAPLRMKRTSPAGEVIRWCIVVLRARVHNRAMFGHRGDLPYS
jgi:hypothetical protein